LAIVAEKDKGAEMGIDINRLIWFADKHASDRKVLVFLVLLLVMSVLMSGVAYRFSLLANGMPPLDVTFFYGSETAERFLAEVPAGAVQFYLQVLSPLDLLYPALYAFSFALLVVWLLKKLALRGHLFPQWLVLISFVVALFDYLENIGVVTMLHLNPAVPHLLVVATSLCSSIKWLGAFGGLAVLLYMLFKLITARPERFGRLS
jgi:hypothetical protein